jgi:hypothetical protein
MSTGTRTFLWIIGILVGLAVIGFIAGQTLTSG